jgi:hypothetical protein
MRRCILKDDAASFAACSLIRTLAKRSVLASSPRAFILSSLQAGLGGGGGGGVWHYMCEIG